MAGAAAALIETFEALALPAVALDAPTFAIVASTTVGAELLGLSPQTRDASWLDRIHPEDRSRMVDALRAGKSARFSFRFSREHLAFQKIECELRPLDGFAFALLDESTPEATPERAELEALLEALPFDVWERDAKGVLIRQNAQALKNWGAQLGRGIDDMGLSPEVAQLWKDMNSRAMNGEIVHAPVDYEIAGRKVNYVYLIAPVHENGEIRGVVGVNIDITATKFAEAELARAQTHLVQRERLAALGELAAVVAHEVRNPLGAIFNSLSSLRRQLTLTGDAAVLFNILEEEAARLNRTVGDLLNYVRPLEPERRLEDLLELARDALLQGLRTSRAGSTPIESAVIADGVVEPLATDPILLRIALANLVTNAVQAMPDGGRLEITIKSAKHRGRDAVAITVNDSGKGIPPDVLERVFEPFFTTRASGTGLGLAVVRRIVEAHNGSVLAESEPTRGTAFTLLLPRMTL